MSLTPVMDKCLKEQSKRTQINDKAGNKAGNLRAVHLQVNVSAAKSNVLDKEAGQN